MNNAEQAASTQKLSYEQLLAKYDAQEAERKRLETELAAAKESKARQNTVSFKCRAKGERYTDNKGVERTGTGVLSMYGLGRFPVSLYESQWNTLIKAVKDGSVEKALKEHAAKLSKQ